MPLTLELQDVCSPLNPYTAFGTASHATRYQNSEYLKHVASQEYASDSTFIPNRFPPGPPGDMDKDSPCRGAWECLMPDSEGWAMCWVCPVQGDAAIQTDGQVTRI